MVDVPADEATRRLVAQTITRVREDFEVMRMNTAIAKLITLNNHLTGLAEVPRQSVGRSGWIAYRGELHRTPGK